MGKETKKRYGERESRQRPLCSKLHQPAGEEQRALLPPLCPPQSRWPMPPRWQDLETGRRTKVGQRNSPDLLLVDICKPGSWVQPDGYFPEITESPFCLYCCSDAHSPISFTRILRRWSLYSLSNTTCHLLGSPRLQRE